MAIYSLNMSNVSRAKGSSALATLAYISGEEIYDERLGQVFKYSREDHVLATYTLLPEGAPDEFKDPARLFNSLEEFEKSSSARIAKKIIIALPREFSLYDREESVRDFVQENFVSQGYAATYSFHTSKDTQNPHVHILIANRQIDAKTGKWVKTKRKTTFALDEDGQRIPVIDPETGEQKVRKRAGKGTEKIWKRVTVESTNLLDRKETLKIIRKSWADVANKYLQEYWQSPQIDHRSHAERGLDTIPTVHEGYRARKRAAQGLYSDRVEINKDIKAANEEIASLRQALARIAQQIRELLERIQKALQEKEKEETPSKEKPASSTPNFFTNFKEQHDQQELEKALASVRRHYEVKTRTIQGKKSYIIRQKGKPDTESYVYSEKEIFSLARNIEKQTPKQKPPTHTFPTSKNLDTDYSL